MTQRCALALVSGVLLIVAACGTGEPDLATLQRDPAATIRLADAVELGHFYGDKHMSLDGPQPAFDSHVFGAQVTDDAVKAFYDRQLRQFGWQADPLAGTMMSAELSATGWCKGAMEFRIGIEDQARAFKPEFYRGQTFRTVYDAAIQGRDPALGCPERPRR